jgi:hypothetical protein
MAAKVVLTALALVPLLFVFVHPSTSPGATTLQQRADIIRLPVLVFAAAALSLVPRLVALRYWQSELHVVNLAKHSLSDLTCVRLC